MQGTALVLPEQCVLGIAAAYACTYVLLENVLDLAQLVGQLLISVFAQVLVCFAPLSHLDTKLESSFRVSFFDALVLLPLLLCIKVIPRTSLLL